MKIVCVGSSAGGLAPTIEFFKHLPADTGMGFVVIQHLKADVPSLTPALLARITPMPVAAAIDREPVLADHVYTIPPNVQLTVVDGRFRLAPRTETSSRHKPFDRFLNSLAIDAGPRAIAVILSGYDGDGSLGFIAIKDHGGATYAQNQSAAIGEMPEHAIATGCVDHVLDPGQIAERISSEH